MNHSMLSDLLKSAFKFQQDTSDQVLRQSTLKMIFNVFVEVSVFTVFEDQIEIVSGLFIINEVHDVRVLHH